MKKIILLLCVISIAASTLVGCSNSSSKFQKSIFGNTRITHCESHVKAYKKFNK